MEVKGYNKDYKWSYSAKQILMSDREIPINFKVLNDKFKIVIKRMELWMLEWSDASTKVHGLSPDKETPMDTSHVGKLKKKLN